MKRKLLDWLVCPCCRTDFGCSVTGEENGEIKTGLLECGCGRYPITDFIPRLLPQQRQPISGRERGPRPASREQKLLRRTRASFGYQWSAFGRMDETFENNFLNYIAPVKPEFFPGRLGLDAGCGFGRHLHYATRYGAEMVGLDASKAIDVARKNASCDGSHFVQGDLLHPPFRQGVFDFVYCLGVLHHLPDPEAGFRSLQRLAREDGAFWIWVYSKRRRFQNALLETARTVTKSLPFPLLKAISLAAAVVDYGLFVAPSRRLIRSRFSSWVPPRLALYASYPFQVSYADWFDRLSAPVRFYYDERDLSGWAERAGWSRYQIRPTGLYGFRLQRGGERGTPCAA
jgi:SAM-dependent methyltransferase/uncharacterized protein YbaR (Trm112 family)